MLASWEPSENIFFTEKSFIAILYSPLMCRPVLITCHRSGIFAFSYLLRHLESQPRPGFCCCCCCSFPLNLPVLANNDGQSATIVRKLEKTDVQKKNRGKGEKNSKHSVVKVSQSQRKCWKSMFRKGLSTALSEKQVLCHQDLNTLWLLLEIKRLYAHSCHNSITNRVCISSRALSHTLSTMHGEQQ